MKLFLNYPLKIYFSRKSFLMLFLISSICISLKVKLFNVSFLKVGSSFFSFIFVCKQYFIIFLKYFLNSFYNLNCLYFFRLKLKGLGYRIVKICKSLYKFFFVYTNFYYLHLPSSVFLKMKSRKLIFFGFNLQILRLVLSKLLLLKRTLIYLVRGLLFPRQIIVLKPGKKRT